MQESRESHERQRIGVWKLEKVGAPLDARRRRYAKGFAFLGVACPLPAQELASEDAIIT